MSLCGTFCEKKYLCCVTFNPRFKIVSMKHIEAFCVFSSYIAISDPIINFSLLASFSFLDANSGHTLPFYLTTFGFSCLVFNTVSEEKLKCLLYSSYFQMQILKSFKFSLKEKRVKNQQLFLFRKFGFKD